MAIASETFRVNYPIEDVFDFVADGTNNKLWRPEVAGVIFAAGPSERAVWAQTLTTPEGRRRKADYRISWYERPGKLETTVFNGPWRPTTTFVFRALSATSTEVTCTVDVKPLGYSFDRTRFGAAMAHTLAGAALGIGDAMARPRTRR